MAGRPADLPNDAMTKRRLKSSGVACPCSAVKLSGENINTPHTMQELVTLWKVLGKWRR